MRVPFGQEVSTNDLQPTSEIGMQSVYNNVFHIIVSWKTSLLELEFETIFVLFEWSVFVPLLPFHFACNRLEFVHIFNLFSNSASKCMKI